MKNKKCFFYKVKLTTYIRKQKTKISIKGYYCGEVENFSHYLEKINAELVKHKEVELENISNVKSKIKYSTLIDFLSTFKTLLQTKVDILDSLKKYSQTVKDINLLFILKIIILEIENGTEPLNALLNHPHLLRNKTLGIFISDKPDLSIIDKALESLAKFHQRNTQIKTLLIYPAFLGLSLFLFLLILYPVAWQPKYYIPNYTFRLINKGIYQTVLFLSSLFLALLIVNVLLKTSFLMRLFKKIPFLNKSYRYESLSNFCQVLAQNSRQNSSIIDNLMTARKLLIDKKDITWCNQAIQYLKEGYDFEKVIKEKVHHPLLTFFLQNGSDKDRLEYYLFTASKFFSYLNSKSYNFFRKFVIPILILIVGIFVGLVGINLFSYIYSFVRSIL